MAIGQVIVNNLNLAQGSFPEVERKFLYIGVAKKATTLRSLKKARIADFKIHAVNTDSDFDQLFGTDDSDLKTQLTAARLNAGQNWMAWAVPIEEAEEWTAAVDQAMEKPFDIDCEAVVVCKPVTDKAGVEAAHAKMEEIRAKYGKFLTCHMAVAGIEAAQEWSAYIAAIKALNTAVAGYRVSLIPQLNKNNLGVVCGRLCNFSASIADTPMRVNTGPLLGLGEHPVDSAKVPLNMAHVAELSEARFSVHQWYAGYEGMYWADHMTLDTETGDFQVYENIRVLDYLARRVRPLAISRIADRTLNSTPKSTSHAKTFFMRPLRAAYRAGLIQQVEDNDIVITWITRTEIAIFIQAAPFDCPKKIGINLALDLNRGF